jgi:hypothetical protein
MGRVDPDSLDGESINEFFDFALENPNFFREGKNLDPAEMAIIRDGYIWAVSYIKKIPKNWKEALGNAFYIPNLKDYNKQQKDEWFQTEEDLLTKRNGKQPTSLEIIADAEEHENMTRFKLIYALKKPLNVTLAYNWYNLSVIRENVDLFLACATIIDPSDRPYPYFDIICKNSLVEKHTN